MILASSAQLLALFMMPVLSVMVTARLWCWLLPPTDIPSQTRS